MRCSADRGRNWGLVGVKRFGWVCRGGFAARACDSEAEMRGRDESGGSGLLWFVVLDHRLGLVVEVEKVYLSLLLRRRGG